MKKIKIFNIYKLKNNLRDGIENFSKLDCEFIMPVVDMVDDVLFGVVSTKKSKEITLNIYNERENAFDLNLDRFYKISKKNLENNIFLDEQVIDENKIGKRKELEILENIKKLFDDYNSNVKLTYIYKKSPNLRQNL
ncbi:hypothetical protein MCANUFG4_00833 [Mycoplasmopsis canis UFG4]|uniref:Uncharacterized protein n=1 Tax=Mycoplasmopsis canis UFG4 TaxID=1131455 RepID=I1A6L4_9BACT|nr:hypothetical protein [Mycoplasmopsis canis]EIE42135.1 hypothetical protein MCANUFG4_00833 [Mycoplasmopsis canis UFG4]